MNSLDHYIEKEDFRTDRISPRVVKQVISDLMTERKIFTIGAAFVVIGTLATLAEPRLFGMAIDRAILPKDMPALRMYALVYFGLISIRVACTIAQYFLFEVLGQRMMQRLRLKLFDHLQRLPVSTFDRTPVGRMITRITNDTSSMSEMFSAGFVTFFGNLFFILGIFIWLFLMNWKLALIATCLFPVLVILSTRFSRKLVANFREARMKMSSLNAFLAENILGMRVVNLFSKRDRHFQRFQAVNEEHAQAQMSSVRVYASFQPLITWCSGAGVALVLVYGGRDALRGLITPGELVTFISYLLLLFQPIRELVDRWTIFLSGMTSAERIYGLLEWNEEMTSQDSAGEPTRLNLRGEIEFENVWFAYADENWILKDFSLKIRAGDSVGVVGHTGAGKTTLISLLLRFYDVQKGRILIDGKDIRDYPKRDLRAAFGLIQQDVFIFSGRIEENLHLGKGERKLSPEVEEALEKLNLKHALKDELDERGANLSMGERQILSFARALQKKPDLWILDEATSNIDSETERKISTLLQAATERKTLITIAHRLATVRDADQILVLHKGELIEQGTHSELIRKNGTYAHLYRYQSTVEVILPEGLGQSQEKVATTE